jgi:hypothetical protein
MYEDCCSMLRSFACLILLCIPIELMVKFPPWSKRNYNNLHLYHTVFGLPLVEQDSDSEVTTLSILTTTYRTPNPPMTTSRSHHSASTPNSNRSRSQTADQVQQKPVQELPSSESHQRSPRSATILRPRSTQVTL